MTISKNIEINNDIVLIASPAIELMLLTLSIIASEKKKDSKGKASILLNWNRYNPYSTSLPFDWNPNNWKSKNRNSDETAKTNNDLMYKLLSFLKNAIIPELTGNISKTGVAESLKNGGINAKNPNKKKCK